MTALEISLLIVIVALLELDTLAAFQTMVSRPLVAGVLCGLVLGDPAAAAAAACVLELLWLGRLPVGSVVPPNLCLGGAAAGVGSVYLGRQFPHAFEAAAAAAVIASILVAYAGGFAEIRFRRKTQGLARDIEEQVLSGNESALLRGIIKGLALRFLLAAVLMTLVLLVLLPMTSLALAGLDQRMFAALEWFYWLSLLLGMVILLDYFWERRSLKLAGFCFFLFAVAIYAFQIEPAAVLPLAALAGLWAYWKEPISKKRASHG